MITQVTVTQVTVTQVTVTQGTVTQVTGIRNKSVRGFLRKVQVTLQVGDQFITLDQLGFDGRFQGRIQQSVVVDQVQAVLRGGLRLDFIGGIVRDGGIHGHGRIGGREADVIRGGRDGVGRDNTVGVFLDEGSLVAGGIVLRDRFRVVMSLVWWGRDFAGTIEGHVAGQNQPDGGIRCGFLFCQAEQRLLQVGCGQTGRGGVHVVECRHSGGIQPHRANWHLGFAQTHADSRWEGFR